MTEQQIASALDELITLMAEGKSIEAFDKFYHNDIEKTDLDGVVKKGKPANDKANQELLNKITAVRDLTAIGKIVKGNRSFLVWSVDFDHADNGQVKAVEVAIQDWQDGKIIRERFIA